MRALACKHVSPRTFSLPQPPGMPDQMDLNSNGRRMLVLRERITTSHTLLSSFLRDSSSLAPHREPSPLANPYPIASQMGEWSDTDLHGGTADLLALGVWIYFMYGKKLGDLALTKGQRMLIMGDHLFSLLLPLTLLLLLRPKCCHLYSCPPYHRTSLPGRLIIHRRNPGRRT